MGRKGLVGSLYGLYELVQFPWERLILLSCLAVGSWWLYGKVSRCQAEVSGIIDHAQYIVHSSPCNEKRDRFKDAINCEEFARKLQPEYQEELWWSCFLNTFIFYRSWMGLAVFGAVIYAIASVCRVPKYKPPKPVIRPERRIRYYDPPLLEYPEERRSPRKHRSREASYESSDDEVY